MVGDAPRSVITGVPGWESEAEQYHLLRLAKEVSDRGVIVEIGAEFGMSASIFCHGTAPSCHIVSVDLFPGDLLDIHRQNLREAGFEGRSFQVKRDSSVFGSMWGSVQWDAGQDIEIDLLFIDGDHSYDGVKRDIFSWIPSVKRGGKIVFHDAAPPTNRAPHPLHLDVENAINDWDMLYLYPELAPVDSIRTFVKP